MTASMSRADWLAEEIRADREYALRCAESDDPIERVQASRRSREADAKQAELEALADGAHLSLRLTGRGIRHHSAPLAVVKGLIQQIETLADEFGADMLVAPAAAGSHVIEVTAAHEPSLFEDDARFDPQVAFTDAAHVLLALAPPPLGDSERWEASVEQVASELSPAALLAARHFVEVLADHHVTVDLGLRSRRSAGRAHLTDEGAAFVRRVLSNVERDVELVEYSGVLSGFTKGSGRFEIEVDGDEVSGRVPKSLRTAADGVPIGSRVVVSVEKVTTTLRSGSIREHLRLVDISQLS
ncbi:MAG: hypothetical protein KDB37_11775 [Ilumatobacter sp.]|nr:hypothetical protein [Ilumatobacter sp.]